MWLREPRAPGHDLPPPRRARREDAMVANERVARGRDERGEARQELERRHDAGLGPLSAELLHAVGDAAAGQETEALERERRARAVAAEAFATEVVPGFDTDAGLHVEAVEIDGLVRGLGRDRLGNDDVVERRVVGQRLEGRGGRWRRVEDEAAVVLGEEDAVEDDDVEVHVEVEAAAEALHEGDGAALRRRCGEAASRADLVRAKMLSTKMRESAERTSARKAASMRTSNGSESTHWRTGTAGSTRSVRCAAVFAMRRPVQLGQMPRPLHENATRRSLPQRSQRRWTNPCAKTPHRR